MKQLYNILMTLMLIVTGPLAAADEYGLVFSSYDAPLSQRTSLQLVFPQSKALEFNGSTVKICFDIKIDVTKESYGYICRIPLLNDLSLDMVLSNSRIVRNANDIVAVLGGQVVSAIPDGNNLNDWNTIEIEFHETSDSLAVSINGNSMVAATNGAKGELSAILFGKHEYGDLRSDDVAPMIIRNMAIESQGKKTAHYEYPLRDATGLAGAIANPIWLSDYNTLWHLELDIPAQGKVFHTIDREKHCLYIITDDEVKRYALSSRTLETRTVSENIDLTPLTNDFGVLPDGTLYYFDSETYTTAKFEWESSSWSRDIVKDTFSPYLGHSSFYNPKDSSVVQLFGYGYHRYSNEAHTWNVETGKFRRFNIDQISPRYFSCLYQTDSSILVIGGLGNRLGIQEAGIETFSDVYEIRLSDYSVSKVCLPKQAFPEEMVSFGNAIKHNNNYHFLAFPYGASDSGLRLLSYNPETSKIEGRSGILAYAMSQWSEFFLDYVEDNDTWYSIVSTVDSEGLYHTYVYSSVNPLGYSEEQPADDKPTWIIWTLASLLVVGVSSGLVIHERKKRRRIVHIRNIHPGNPGIYMIGSFRVINKDGKDVVSSFSPLMKELLCILLLNYNEGISAHELNMALWPDMEECNFRNNFRVNLKKVRDALKDVVPVEIYKDGPLWKVSIDEKDCDYLIATRNIQDLTGGYLPWAEIDRLVRQFKMGNLLEDINKEWLDDYKASYSSSVISICYKLIDEFSDSESRLKLSEIILSLDSIEEAAASIKCKALIQLKKPSSAQDFYRSFSNEYKKLMDEPFEKTYKDFVK